jgi:hypothetical protein
MKTKNSSGWKVIIAAIILIAVAVLSYSLLTNDTVDCNSGAFQGYRLAVPANANDVHESCRNGLNPTYQSSFSITPNDLEAVKQDSYIKEISTWQTSVPGDSAFNVQAAQAKSVLYGIFSNGAVAAEVLIDTSNAELYKLYVRLVNTD